MRWKAPISRFSRTVILGKMRRPSGACEMPFATIAWGVVPSIRSPSNQISPRRGRSRPEIVLSVVDLPAPFAPMRVTISPASTDSVRPLRAWMLP